MPRGIITAPDVKELIIEKVKQGIPIPQLEREYSISDKTIYSWLRNPDSGSGGVSKVVSNSSKSDALIIARLIKEKQELTQIIGKFCVQLEQLQNGEFKKKLNFRSSKIVYSS
jgi:hypothetical protein